MDAKQLVVNDVVAAIGGEIEVKLIALKSEAMAFAKCETKEQSLEIKAVHTRVKDARIWLKNRGEEVRAPAVEFQKNVIKYVDDKTAFIAQAESHLNSLLGDFEAAERKRIDDAKNAKIERAKRLKSIADSFVVVAMFDDTALSIGAKIDTLKAVNVADLDLAEYEPVAMANINASIQNLTSALEICKKREELAEAEAKAKAEAEAERRAAEARQKELDRIAAEELAKAKAEAEAAKAQLEELARQERIKRDEEAREVARLAAEKAKAEAEELARIEKEAADKAALEASEAEKVRRDENKPDAEAISEMASKFLEIISEYAPRLERNKSALELFACEIRASVSHIRSVMIGE